MADVDVDVETFVAAVRASARDTFDADELAQLWRTAAASWPGVHVAPADLAARIVASGLALADLRAADLYLALGCLHGDATALEFFEQLLAPTRTGLLRAGFDAALVDDALQLVRYRLLVATPDREAKLATYRGRGSLAGWLRVVSLRQARALTGPRRERSDDALADAAVETDAALAVLVRTHGAAVRRMFRDAVGTLDRRQRQLLVLEIVDQLPHQQIADRFEVHRTTVVRWIEDARAAIAREVRRELMRELGLSGESADSLLRALAGRIELSVGSGLLSHG